MPYFIDHYPMEEHVYHVFGMDIPIYNCALIEALNMLPAESRVIVLAAYCAELPDRVIADNLHLVRRTVSYRRLRALEKLRQQLENV